MSQIRRIGNVDYEPRTHKLEVKKVEGGFEVTAQGVEGTAWKGTTEQAAVRAATKGMEALHAKRAMTNLPEWMKKEMEKGKG